MAVHLLADLLDRVPCLRHERLDRRTVGRASSRNEPLAAGWCGGVIVPREDILDKVWGYEVYPSTRTIDNFIVRLRRRFERNPEAPEYFHTVRGVGYRFTQEPETPTE